MPITERTRPLSLAQILKLLPPSDRKDMFNMESRGRKLRIGSVRSSISDLM